MFQEIVAELAAEVTEIICTYIYFCDAWRILNNNIMIIIPNGLMQFK